MDKPAPHRVLLVIIAVLLGIIIALIAAILTTHNGATLATAITTGGVAFAGTVSLALLIMKTLHIL
ncbi:hypothetical protein [Amycolatopsis minnesotensis]|uniref:Uncharacterized protein n=1 Tax=Amycolatopsis minnesotensis TaxID=337894 RepID=A0ABP5ECI4_9PSEU